MKAEKIKVYKRKRSLKRRESENCTSEDLYNRKCTAESGLLMMKTTAVFDLRVQRSLLKLKRCQSWHLPSPHPPWYLFQRIAVDKFALDVGRQKWAPACGSFSRAVEFAPWRDPTRGSAYTRPLAQ